MNASTESTELTPEQVEELDQRLEAFAERAESPKLPKQETSDESITAIAEKFAGYISVVGDALGVLETLMGQLMEKLDIVEARVEALHELFRPKITHSAKASWQMAAKNAATSRRKADPDAGE